MVKLLQRVKEFFLGKSAAVLAEEKAAYDVAVARDCSYCGKSATRQCFHVRTEIDISVNATPLSSSQTGWITFTCDDAACILKGRAEESLRIEEYPWPPPQSACVL